MSPFPIGSSVLYHHPDHPRAKLAPLYTSATVLQRISEHVFRLRLPSGRPILSHRWCIRPNDSPHPDPVYVVPLPLDSPSERPDTSIGSPHQAQQQQPQQSSNIQYPSDQPPSPKFDITDFGKDELILWRDENTGRCFLGSVRTVDLEGASVVYLWNEDTESAIRIALAMAFAHSDFDPREIVVADVKTAYLTALRSDSLYVHPPKDHPDHGKFLWLLNRALYGLRDSGNLWDRSRNKTLAAAGRSAVQLAREIAAKGGYQMKITKPENGTLRWAGVDFNVSRNSVHIHQTEYLLSLPLPEGMEDSADSSASVPSSVPTPPPDLFPLPPSSRELPSKPLRLLTTQEGKAFRERLGCFSWVARDTRPDLSQGCNQLSRHSSAPTHTDADYLLSFLRYARRTATSRILRISRSDVPSTSSPLSTKSWSDAALGSAGNAHPQSGWLFTLKFTILHWRAFSQKRVARSSTRAELYAAHDLVDFLECLLPVLRCVWKAGVMAEVGVDSNDLLKLVSSEMPRPTEHALQSVIESLQLCIIEKSPCTLVLHTLSLCDALDEASIRLSFVRSHSNMADPLTKPTFIELLLHFFTSHSSPSVTSTPSLIVL
uniref:Reverse transcriptase Ty1/copia-type domain-containing protein n=1 Tax=Chromera velia CCMP2878 TaxID=1169474 RepID=A0A0G4FX24_9ALVE|eukprot:Cvel_19033.t1-p1 / transcript=Cvel_19033.t1 / gene=Cvel_19033 / organism=Chromera_velia_CCMP2878 / gene_product=hypothetical protein / transcript_product=hypothetical protein / location=Cvel_scaffold1612:22426-25039(-) / protein_length=601 / sequence_SO=supercontig / SO=protein_coding / is_pseudo=false